MTSPLATARVWHHAAGWLETACSVESIGVLSETDVINQTRTNSLDVLPAPRQLQGQQDKPPGMILETGSGKQDRPHTLLHVLFPDQLLKGGTSVAKQQRIINPGGYESVRRSKKYGSRPPYMYTSLCPDPRYRIKQPEKKKE